MKRIFTLNIITTGKANNKDKREKAAKVDSYLRHTRSTLWVDILKKRVIAERKEIVQKLPQP